MNIAHAVRKPHLSFVLGAVLLCSFTAAANATTLFQDLFTHQNGTLTSFGGWYAHSASGSKPIQVTDNEVVVLQGAGSGEDINHPFTPPDSLAKTYASFTLRVPAGSTMAVNDYFLHFRPAGNDSNNFVARTYVGPPTAGGDYVLGIAAGSLTSTPLAPWATGLTFGQTYQVVIAYDGATGTSTLWVNPTSEASTSVSSTAASLFHRTLSSIAMRQATPAGATTTQIIDSVGIHTAFPFIPLPGLATWGAIALASLLLLTGGTYAMRRRDARS